MPQTDSEKENAPGCKGIPDNVAMNVDGGAQENTHGTVSASEGEIKEKLGLQEGDAKCSIPMDGKDKPVDGEIMENGKVNPMGPADAPQPQLLCNICFSSNSGDSDVLGDCSFNVIASLIIC